MSYFNEGQSDAFDQLVDLANAGYGVSESLSIINNTLGEGIGKHASQSDISYALGVEDVCYEFLKTASDIAGAYDIDDDHEYMVSVLDSMYENVDHGGTYAFRMGKTAALEDLMGLANYHGDVSVCIDAAMNTVSQGIGKYASEEDVDYRLGVESACYEFMKTASEVYGTYDVSYADDLDILGEVFNKIAYVLEPEYYGTPEFFVKSEDRAKVEELPKPKRNIRPLSEEGRKKQKARIQKIKDNHALAEAQDTIKRLGGEGKKDPGLLSRAGSRIKGVGSGAKRHLWDNRTGLQRAGIGVGAATLTAGGAYGAKKLRDRRRRKQEEEGQGHRKAASLGYHSDVEQALDVLYAEGLLD